MDCKKVILREQDARGQVLDHLGLVSSVISRLKLIEKIDARIKVSKEKGAKITMGQRLAAMILNGLGFTDDRLYMFPQFLENKPVERLLGKGILASDFNDDALGRLLDAVSDYGVTPLFSEIALDIGVVEGLLGPSAHFDTTSINVYGEYEETGQPCSTAPSEKAENLEPFKLAYGHSKDHRFDLKQMVLNLATTGAAGFPIWMESHSGNASDKKILQAGAAKMHAFCERLKTSPKFLYVGDSALYERCVKEKVLFLWLSRVPERLKEAKKWLHMEDSAFTWSPLDNGYKMAPLPDAQYGEVKQRWIMIHSEKAAARELKTLQRQIQKERDAYEKVLWHLSNKDFKCEHDAVQAGIGEIKSLKYHQVTWVTTTVEKHAGAGRPKKGALPVNVGCHIAGVLAEDAARINLTKLRKGRFILATNQLDKVMLPDADLLPEYKKQYKTEHGFAFIKGDTFEVASVFLKTPSRIEALMMVMTLCLMVYSFAQHQLRQALEAANETIPNQLKKPTKSPSIAWVFRLFHGVQIWIVQQNEMTQQLVVNLNGLLKRIIKYFGSNAERIYSASG
jgi:transposase